MDGVTKLEPQSRPMDPERILKKLPGWLFNLALVALIAVGVYFRFAWGNWSEGGNLHPDEYGLTGTLTQLSFPQSFSEYFNTRVSPLSPYHKYDETGNQIANGPDNRMRWGQAPQIIIRGTAEALNGLQETLLPAWGRFRMDTLKWEGPAQPPVDYTMYNEIRLLGRGLSAWCDTLSLLLCFLIGLRLFRPRIALMGTALSALAVMQIQQSHFMTIDNFGVLFSMLTMYCVVRIAQKGRMGWYAGFGIGLALTVASRVNLAPVGFLILPAIWLAERERWARPDLTRWARIGPILLSLALAGVTAAVAFKFAQPMTFRAPTGDSSFFTLDLNNDWVDSMKVAAEESSGGGGPPAEQWTNRPAILFPLINMVVWGMGLPLGLAGWAGILLALWWIYKGREWQVHLIPVAYTLIVFLFLGTRWVKSMRYFLAIYPFLSLYAAWVVAQLWGALERRGKWGKVIAGTVAGIVLLGTLTWAWGFTNIYRSGNSRIQASRWIFQNIPSPIMLHITTDDGEEYVEPISFNGRQIGVEPVTVGFTPRKGGTVTGIGFGTAVNNGAASTVRIVLSELPDGRTPIAAASIRVPYGRSAGLETALGPANLSLSADPRRTYYLQLALAEEGAVELRGAVMANESWDEAMPERIDGRDGFGGLYTGLTMEIRWPDDEHKRDMMLQVLAETEYLILPSQRAIWSASRLPAAYPMTLTYYRALFDGSLGFDLVAQFQNPILIGPLQVSDLGGTLAWNEKPTLPLFNDNILSAEEAFSVYDHAPVWIFRKRADFSLAKAEAIIRAVDLTKVVSQNPHTATDYPTMLMLPADRLTGQQEGGTWSEMFSRWMVLNRYPGLAAIAWWLWAVITGWVTLPLIGRAFRGLPDEGYALAKIAGWMVVAWAAWMLGSAGVAFTQTTILLCWLTLAAAGITVGILDREHWKPAFQKLWKTWLAMEILFLAFFLFDLLIRLGNSDLWHPSKGGEKPMDFAYLNAVLKSSTFPPYDPWFAGGYLNYYYYGYVLAAIPIKMLATVPAIAYNIALPTLFATIGVSAYGIAWNLAEGLRRARPTPVPAVVAGVAAALMVVVLGNLGEVQLLWTGLVRASTLPLPEGLVFGFGDLLHALNGGYRILTGSTTFPFGSDSWYWNASRMIPVPTGSDGSPLEIGPITEFPFFTFLYADLHAHMLAMPMLLLSLGGAVALVMNASVLKSFWRPLPLIALTAIATGAIWPTNAWNLPMAVVVVLAAFGLAGWRMLSTSTGVRDWRGWIRVGFLAGVFLILMYALYLPFYKWNGPTYSQLEFWKGSRTPWDAYLWIHGLFLFILVSYTLWHLRDALEKTSVQEARAILVGPLPAFSLLVLAVTMVLAIALGYQVIALTLPVFLLSVALGLRRNLADEHRLVFGVFAVCIGIGWFVEIFIISDTLDRMNTVFKFYIQSWILFSVIAGVALWWLAGEWSRWRPALQNVWLAVLGVLTAGCLFYTVQASVTKIDDRITGDTPHTLDGMLYMEYAQWGDDHTNGLIELKDDARAIRWMQENVQGSPVIVEANMFDLYRWGNRFSIYTGLPDVVGWNWHQRQQRGIIQDQEVWSRGRAIDEFYNTLDTGAAMAFLRAYDVRYVIVGLLERGMYAAEGLAKLERMAEQGGLEKVYDEGSTLIYLVPDAG